MRRKKNIKTEEDDNENLDPHDKPEANSGNSQQFDLDQERQERMQRNERILQELGLVPLIKSMQSTAPAAAAEAKKTAQRKRGQAADSAGTEDRVVRRSLRTRGQEPELPPILASTFGRSPDERPYREAAARPRPAATTTDGSDASKFDAHNLHRLRTMSDDAMVKRINKITNTLKLKSLVQLLREFGRDVLAEEAQTALDARIANV